MSTRSSIPSASRGEGLVVANSPVADGLLKLDLALSCEPLFLPGQFAMLNLVGSDAWIFGRPLSILAWHDGVVSFLYKIVGRGTAALSRCLPGTRLSFLGPLGQPFPEPVTGTETLLIAGGVGLPPLHAWAQRHCAAPMSLFFGARSGNDVPWSLLPEPWLVSVEKKLGLADHHAVLGLVTDLVAATIEPQDDARSRMVLACGPWPLLKAVHKISRHWGWDCWLSLEEHMGCGYGACKGCVVPVLAQGADRTEEWRPATCCQEGPVFPADSLAWSELE